MENKNPSKPHAIQLPMYSMQLDVTTGELTITRDDENGKLTYEDVKDYIDGQ